MNAAKRGSIVNGAAVVEPVSVQNLATLLDRAAARFGNRSMIVDRNETLSFLEVFEGANQVANLLKKRGISHGDKVAISCPNIAAFSAIYFGILKAGATVVPLSTLLTAREIAYHLEDSDAKAVFAFGGFGDVGDVGEERFGSTKEAVADGFSQVDSCSDLLVIEEAANRQGSALAAGLARQATTFETVQVDPDDTAVILFTSGTSGRPKGAELRHRNLRDNALAAVAASASDPVNPDVYLAALPLYHSFGQTNIQNASLIVGGTVVMMPRFNADAALTLMTEHSVTFFAGVPTMYWGLLDIVDGTNEDTPLALRVAISGGVALPGEIHRRFAEKFGVIILEGYGLSETSPLVSLSPYGKEPKVGSIGIPVNDVQMKLIDDNWNTLTPGPDVVGEVAIKGHNVMKGYYCRPDATAEAIRDGWFRSGDLARCDEDGYYYIVDRAKELIIRGGFNVYPREVEEVLITHPAVSLVAVIGVPHESHGEEIKAVVVKNRGHEDVSENDIMSWARTELASYKYPRLIDFVEALPMTSTGKILKRELS